MWRPPREVARQVEGWILGRRFGAGSKLPGERELAIRLETSRNVPREALKILETRSVVKVCRGVGTFVADMALQGYLTIPVQLSSWRTSSNQKLLPARPVAPLGRPARRPGRKWR